MTTAKDYFSRTLQKGEVIDDYRSLAQSPDTTGKRHTFALSMMKQNDLVMDVGCGTGLLLCGMQAAGLRPAHYRGLDLFQKVIDVARKRADEMHLAATFVRVTGPLIREVEARRADVVFCLGVMGYGDGRGGPDDFTSPHRISEFVRVLKASSPRGAVSLPLACPPAKDEDGFHRFTAEEVIEVAVGTGGVGLHKLDDWNLMLYWR